MSHANPASHRTAQARQVDRSLCISTLNYLAAKIEQDPNCWDIDRQDTAADVEFHSMFDHFAATQEPGA